MTTMDRYELLAKALTEWASKKRHMGCQSAADFIVNRVPDFRKEHLDRHTATGDYYGHTVVTDGLIRVDVSPYADKPRAG